MLIHNFELILIHFPSYFQLPNSKSLPTRKSRRSSTRIVIYNWCGNMASIRGPRPPWRMAMCCLENLSPFRSTCTANRSRRLTPSYTKR